MSCVRLVLSLQHAHKVFRYFSRWRPDALLSCAFPVTTKFSRPCLLKKLRRKLSCLRRQCERDLTLQFCPVFRCFEERCNVLPKACVSCVMLENELQRDESGALADVGKQTLNFSHQERSNHSQTILQTVATRGAQIF